MKKLILSFMALILLVVVATNCSTSAVEAEKSPPQAKLELIASTNIIDVYRLTDIQRNNGVRYIVLGITRGSPVSVGVSP